MQSPPTGRTRMRLHKYFRFIVHSKLANQVWIYIYVHGAVVTGTWWWVGYMALGRLQMEIITVQTWRMRNIQLIWFRYCRCYCCCCYCCRCWLGCCAKSIKNLVQFKFKCAPSSWDSRHPALISLFACLLNAGKIIVASHLAFWALTEI